MLNSLTFTCRKKGANGPNWINRNIENIGVKFVHLSLRPWPQTTSRLVHIMEFVE